MHVSHTQPNIETEMISQCEHRDIGLRLPTELSDHFALL